MNGETIEVPKAQFLLDVIAIGMEGDWQWQVSDEVREKLDYTDVCSMQTVENVQVTEQRIEVHFSTTSSVSERVARRTHHHPAEYKNHDVDVWATMIYEWPEDEYDLPVPTVHVEQAEYPTEPSGPFYDPMEHKYDL